MNTILLAVHLGGAVGLGVALLALVVSIWRNVKKEATYLRLAKLIASGTSWQVASGLVLAVLTPSMSIMKVCTNLGIYLTVVVLAELVITQRLRKQSLQKQTLIANA